MRGLWDTISVVRSAPEADGYGGVGAATESTVISSLKARPVLDRSSYARAMMGQDGRQRYLVSVAAPSASILRGDILVLGDGTRIEVESVQQMRRGSGEVEHWTLAGSAIG